MDHQITALRDKVLSAHLPKELEEKLLVQLERLSYALKASASGSFGVYEQTVAYVEWCLSLPWHNFSTDKLDIGYARQIFNKNHYGLEKLKARILEFMSVIILQRKRIQEIKHETVNDKQGIVDYCPVPTVATEEPKVYQAPILCFVGLAGTGKTTMAISVAEALGRQLIRIPFGGLASALDLRGLSRVHPEAEPGLLIKALRRVNVRNPVILLDELDRVSDDKRQEIMGVLIELLDPAQNNAYVDNYIDFPFDLSSAIFVATANNINKVATAVLDRMEVIQMPSYTDDEKLHIAKDYLLPSAIKEAGVPLSAIAVDDKAWPILVRPLGFDAGIRTLHRVIQGMVRRVAWKMLNGEGTKFLINDLNYREFME